MAIVLIHSKKNKNDTNDNESRVHGKFVSHWHIIRYSRVSHSAALSDILTFWEDEPWRITTGPLYIPTAPTAVLSRRSPPRRTQRSAGTAESRLLCRQPSVPIAELSRAEPMPVRDRRITPSRRSRKSAAPSGGSRAGSSASRSR